MGFRASGFAAFPGSLALVQIGAMSMDFAYGGAVRGERSCLDEVDLEGRNY